MKRLSRILLPVLPVGAALLLWLCWDGDSLHQETPLAADLEEEVHPCQDPEVVRAFATTDPITPLSDSTGSVSGAGYQDLLGLSGCIRSWNDFPVSGARVQLRSSRHGRAVDPLEAERLLRERLLGAARLDRAGIAAWAEADGRGCFFVAMEELPNGVYQVVASADGLAPERKLWTWAGRSEEINFRLAAGESIVGMVLDPAGHPVRGASVLALTQGGEGRGNWSGEHELVNQVESGADGTFTLDVYPGTFQLRARTPGFAPSSWRVVRSNSSGLKLVLNSGRAVEGQVKDPQGEPVAGARVSVWREEVVGHWKGAMLGQSAMGNAYARCTTSFGGNFRIDDLPAVQFILLAEKGGYEPRLIDLDLTASPGVVETEVQLEVGWVLRGRVFGPDHQPIVGALVTAARGRSGGGGKSGAGRQDLPSWSARKLRYLPIRLSRAAAVVETDPGGGFQLDTLEPVSYDLSVVADGLLPTRIEGLNPAFHTQQLTVALEAGSSLEGRIVSSKNGQGVGSALLVVGRLGHRRFTRTDVKGHYKVGGLPEGEIDEVRVEADGYGLMTVNDVEVSGSSTRLDLRLVPAIRVSGLVSDASGRPVSGAWVHIQPAKDASELEIADDERTRAHLQHRLSARGQTDASGRFNIEDVNPVSTLEISVRHPAYGVLRPESFPASSGEEILGLQLSFPSSQRR